MKEAAPIIDRTEHYGLIGAGPAGLIAARALKHAGIPYRGLFLCSGISDPVLPNYLGEFTGESMHSIKYCSPELFEGKRVLIVGGGNMRKLGWRAFGTETVREANRVAGVA